MRRFDHSNAVATAIAACAEEAAALRKETEALAALGLESLPVVAEAGERAAIASVLERMPAHSAKTMSEMRTSVSD